mmetsp:Transcript_18616/g.42518  ORF Transcript_18616/g.42518 Transcript_18616/m.42518 type:complete len:384 (+) Transcript_18616:388-1539(+)|eukprot:CAMPEP_0201122196 /NCGR_PEP_ID=MMETSP0850-20130426/5890_1 /ASSEMBLY_ACC=CAM_ASM_000622 /TAXON_ID=183588 /ORGANISM="Pseudo-nitzschia fraudulenta, Strain WWA7" /LENGTH=383 /DNA_ID=CAMNT_0047388823 /DNA_START=365 /DNA_END=1516 /DNA_ORIENTATION=+
MAQEIERRELFGKNVLVEIPTEVFPSQPQIDEIDAATGANCRHGWYESSSPTEEVPAGKGDERGKDDESGKTETSGGVCLHYRSWFPEDTPEDELKGVLVFTHGIHSQSGHASLINDRPLDVALVVKTFVDKGMAVYARDQYGHGFSEGTRFFVPSWEDARDDLIAFCKLAASKHSPSIPLFLSGESFGGTLTILVSRYFQDHPEEAPQNFDSSLLICPAIVGDLPPYVVRMILMQGLAPRFPKWTPFFMPNPVDPGRIWRDKNVLDHYTNPERKRMGLDATGKPFKLGTARALILALEAVRETAIPGYAKPFCIVHGEKDVAVPVAGSELLHNGSETPEDEKEIHVLDEVYHGVLADPYAGMAIDILVSYVEERTNKFVASS